MFGKIIGMFRALTGAEPGREEDGLDPISAEVLLTPEAAITTALRCADFWEQDLRRIVPLLPPSQMAYHISPPIHDPQTDIPPLWPQRPDDWTAQHVLAPTLPGTQEAVPGSPVLDITRLGPVALAEAHAYLAARTEFFARACADDRPPQQELDTVESDLHSAFGGRGLACYGNLTSFDEMGTTSLPAGDLVLQRLIFMATIAASDLQDAADRVGTTMRQHFRSIETGQDLDDITLRGSGPITGTAPDNFDFIARLSTSFLHCADTPVVDLSITALATRPAREPAD